MEDSVIVVVCVDKAIAVVVVVYDSRSVDWKECVNVFVEVRVSVTVASNMLVVVVVVKL